MSENADQTEDAPVSPDDPERRRRPRYPGTHPRRYEQKYKELDERGAAGMHEHVRAQGRTPAGTHIPVMVERVLQELAVAPGMVVADCTIGYGGHAEAFLKAIAPDGRLIGLDVDGVQLERTRKRLSTSAVDTVGSTTQRDSTDAPDIVDRRDARPALSLHRSHFAGLPKVLARVGLQQVDVVFADLGLSSMQIDDPSRGFSYKFDGPLDMRMDDRDAKTAADLLAQLSERQLAAALRDLADEPHADRIARAIVARRGRESIVRTGQLVQLVFEATSTSSKSWRARTEDGVHPAARTFQALRMMVNEEASGLEQFLRIVPHCLRSGGRIGIISFHSGEDRRVKRAFREGFRTGLYDSISEEVIRPDAAETAGNPRSRSAKFRRARRGG